MPDLRWRSGERMTYREWVCHRLPDSPTLAFFGQRVLVLRSGWQVRLCRVGGKRIWRLP